MKKKRNFYEQFHKKEITNPIVEFMERERYDYLHLLLRNVAGKILVVGCGSKDEMDILNEKSEGVGFDISKSAIKKSKKKYPKFDYCVADATQMPFFARTFNCVVCSEVIEHIKEDEKALSEIKRVLRNGGYFFVTTPNWWSWYGLFRKIAEYIFRKPFTSADQPIDNWHTPLSLKKKIEKHGFKTILFRGIWYYPPTGKGKKNIPWIITLPVFKVLYPLEIFLRKTLPWFGHMILFKVMVANNERTTTKKSRANVIYEASYSGSVFSAEVVYDLGIVKPKVYGKIASFSL